MVLSIIESIWEEKTMPDDWEKSIIVPIYQQEGDPMDCGNHRSIKLLEHIMRVLEKILDKKPRDIIPINNTQMSFMPGRGTKDVIFIVRQLPEKFWEVKKDLFFCFVDLEKAYNRVSGQLAFWCLRKKNVPENLVRLVQATYRIAKAVVRTPYGQTDEFNIDVGLHQGSALSPFLFVVVLEVVTEVCRKGTAWELLFADDLALIAESEKELQEKW